MGKKFGVVTGRWFNYLKGKSSLRSKSLSLLIRGFIKGNFTDETLGINMKLNEKQVEMSVLTRNWTNAERTTDVGFILWDCLDLKMSWQVNKLDKVLKLNIAKFYTSLRHLR